MITQSYYRILYLTVLVILVVFFVNIISNFEIINILTTLYQPGGLKGSIKVSIYLISYLFVFMNLLLIILMRNTLLFKLIFFCVLLLFQIDLTYWIIGEEYGFSINQFIIGMTEKSHIMGALETYFTSILKAFSIIIIFLVSLIYLRKKIRITYYYLPILMLPLSLIGSYKVYTISAYTAFEYPSYVKIPIYIAETLNKGWLNIPFVKRNSVEYKVTNEKKYRNILWIVDESIRPEFLSINNYLLDTTPFLKKFKDVVSLGIVSSTANNSAPSNYIMRNGIQLNQLPDNNYKTLKQSNILQFAKKALYKTWFLDGQVQYKQYQNFLSPYDIDNISEYFTIKNRTDSTKLDRILIDKTADIFKNNKSNFVFMVKQGSHVPWLLNYPKDKTIFKPVLKQFESVTFENRNNAINTYANSIKWGVDDFFKELLRKIDLDNTIIFYTSDHGINIAENNMLLHYGLAENPPSTMGSVPILIFAKDINSLYNFEKDIYSAYQIFPTVLEVMGYDENVTSIYNMTLFDKNNKERDRYFFSGYVFGKGFINEF